VPFRFWPPRWDAFQIAPYALGAPGAPDRGAPWNVSRLVALASLGIIAALMTLMLVAVYQAMRPGSAGTQPADLGPWAQAPLPIRAPVPLSAPAGLWLLRGDIELHRARSKDTGRPGTPGADLIELPFVQPIDWVERIAISGGRFWLNAGREPRGGETTDTSSFQHLIEPIRQARFGALILEGAQVTVQRPSGGQQSIDKLDLLVKAATGRGATHATGRFQYRGEAVTFEARLQPAGPAVSAASAGWRLPAQVSIKSPRVEASFDGGIHIDAGSVSLAGRLDMKGASLAAFSTWLGLALPGEPGAGPFAIKGEAAWRDGVLTYEQLQLTLDGQLAQGALSLTLTGPRPFLDGALAFTTLDVAPMKHWLGEVSRTVSAGDGAGQTAPESGSRTARLALFDAIDADLRVSAAKLTGLGAPAGAGALSLTARAGLVVADIAEFEVANGSFSGQVRIDQSLDAVSFRARGTINHADSAALLGMAGASDTSAALSGKANFRFDASGRGRTKQELLRSLTGEALLAMNAGGRMQLDIPALLADVRERKILSFATHDARGGDFQQFDARFAIQHGMIISEHMAMRADGVLMTADGTIQATAGRIYMRVLMDHGLGLARTARLGRSQSVLLHGDLSNPWVVLEEPTGTPIPVIAGPAAAAGVGTGARP
jgi:AsmA-like C-terminal region